MAHRQDDESASINRRDTATVRADYAAWLSEQPLSSRTREAYLAAVTAFVAWLDRREAGPGDALLAPKTEFVLRYLTRPPERRGIHRQLNKGESIFALEDAVFYGNEGRIRLQTLDRQSTQAAALALVSAAIVTWNTRHMNEIVEHERAARRPLDDVDLARLSPAIHAHINLNGRYHIHPDQPPRHLSPGRDTLATYR